MKTITINNEGNEFGNIMILAMRYALGRMTYVTLEVPSFIKKNQEYIDERVCIVMLRDLKRYFEDRENWQYKDHECDYQSWLSLQNWLFNLAKEKQYNTMSLERR